VTAAGSLTKKNKNRYILKTQKAWRDARLFAFSDALGESSAFSNAIFASKRFVLGVRLSN